MYLIVGLGNPGKKYMYTKHNTGYIVVDNIAKQYNCVIDKSKFDGLYCKAKIDNEQVIFLKPTTYMNLSGNSIIKAVNYYDIPPENVIVIYDDVDIDIGKMRIKKSGSAGTHNGMKSVIENLGTTDFPRIRIGIKSQYDVDLVEYVLSNYTKENLKQLDNLSDDVAIAVKYIVSGNIEKAMSQYN